MLFCSCMTFYLRRKLLIRLAAFFSISSQASGNCALERGGSLSATPPEHELPSRFQNFSRRRKASFSERIH
jgi:hypothetical protein